ncbi:MAG: alpha-L-fucosidase [Adhaeribacter sp.]
MFRIIFLILLAAVEGPGVQAQQVKAPAPVGALPAPQQLAWQKLEYYAFVHFNMNTFTDEEWGHGQESPEAFNPSALDCRQWARVAKEAGMKGIILTAKHHDGFCLWPSAYTKHSVKNSKWQQGQGDVLRDLSAACKEYGLKFGVYLSPWDRNHPTYGTPEYNTVFKEMLREVLTQYGEVFEVWFDGANGEGPNGKKQVYDWPAFEATVYQYQPKAIIFSDDGPGCRWVGNENGYAGETNWSTLNRAKVFKGYDKPEELTLGHEDGSHWIPAEADVSIRPGWYYHAAEDHQVKTLKQLADIYYASVGRNANLLLNLPVDRRGLVHEKDAARLLELRAYLDGAFAKDLALGRKASATQVRGKAKQFSAAMATDGKDHTYWATDDKQTAANLEIDFGKPTVLNQVVVQEHLPLGQRVRKFQVQAWVQGSWKQVGAGTTIGHKRILTFADVETDKLLLRITDSKASPAIAAFSAYRAPRLLEPPLIRRSKDGMVNFEAPDQGLKLFYTLDGSTPKPGGQEYNAPFPAEKKQVQVIAYDPVSKRSSALASHTFDRVKKEWHPHNMPATARNQPARALDDDPQTSWFSTDSTLMKMDVDLGEKLTLEGFTYLPPQGRNLKGTIARYRFLVSTDGRNWQPVSSGEFANIKNSPVLQVKKIQPMPARFIRLVSEGDIYGAKQLGIAELGIITK